MLRLKIATAIFLSFFLTRPLLCSTTRAAVEEPSGAAGGSPAGCTLGATADYRVVAPNAVAVICQPVGAGNSIDLPDGGKLEQTDTPTGTILITSSLQIVQPNAGTGNAAIVLLYWNFDPKTNLQPGMTYLFTLTYRDRSPNPTPAPLPVPVNTTETVTLTPVVATNRFLLTSNIGFSVDGHTLATALPQGRDTQLCNIAFKSTSVIERAFSFQCSRLYPVASESPLSLATLQNVPNIQNVGIVSVILSSLPGIPLVPLNSPYSDVLAGSPKFDPKARFARPSAPATKDTALEYLNFNYAAGVGATPAWTVDAKYAPSLKIIEGYTLAPLATANIGNGKIQGQTATDTIDLGGTARHVFVPSVPPWTQSSPPPLHWFKQDIYALTFGVTYETDRHFDRDNVLGTTDFQWLPLHLNNTQQRQQLAQWYSDLQHNSSEVLTDISPYQYRGYDIDFHLGTEGGWDVVQHTVNASKGGAVDLLPMFPIFRIVPQAHALFQIYRFSVDELLVGRYLTMTEKTVVETPSNSLYLLNLNGWKGVNTLNFTYALDTQGNFGINVKYTDGFSPPNYKRVNSVQAGIVLKY